MLHLRMIAPAELAARAEAWLVQLESVTNLVRVPAAAVKPAGDLILCDVAREDGSVILAELQRMQLDVDGSIAVEAVDVSLSQAAARAELAAEGAPADAVLWQDVAVTTSQSAELTSTYLLFMVLAMLIAGLGIITDSVILVIGGMVVGPEYGPLAGVCVAAVQGRGRLLWRSCWALLVGFPVGIVATYGLVVVLRVAEVAPESLARAQTSFISHPDILSVLVALFAGVVGMVSLTTARSGPLIGVLISVTTIPAAADLGVAAAYGNQSELAGAAFQLAINLLCIVTAGIIALRAQRLAFWRRLKRLRSSRVSRSRHRS